MKNQMTLFFLLFIYFCFQNFLAAQNQPQIIIQEPTASRENQFALSPEGKHLVTGDGDKIQVYEVETGSLLQSFPLQGINIGTTFRFTKDGKQLMVIIDPEIYFYELESNKITRRIYAKNPVFNQDLSELLLSADSSQLDIFTGKQTGAPNPFIYRYSLEQKKVIDSINTGMYLIYDYESMVREEFAVC